MNPQTLDEKIAASFGELTIDKALVRQLNIRDNRSIPSFVEEWLISRFQSPDKSQQQVYKDITGFMSKHLPSKNEKNTIKYKLLNGDSIVLLDKFEAHIDLKKGEKRLKINCLDENNASIASDVLDKNQTLLEGGQWGAGRLYVRQEDKHNVIELVEFNPMQSGKVNLSNLVKARQEFTTREWIYLLLRTMGYEPFFYSEEAQTHLLLRLLPIVQNNLNMMELAPKGTGKSFIYDNLSRYVNLHSCTISRAQLFKNLRTQELGLLGNQHDLLVLDEVQNFTGADEVHAKFKEYLESGRYSTGQEKISSECGLMVLANIPLYADGQPRQADYIRHLPEMFHDSALIDRFHGIIAGWKIPRFNTESAAQGLGIKADVFGEYLHQLRTVSQTEFPFGNVPNLTGDSRDVKAVKRLATALSKLLLLNPEHPDYEAYVLNPAKALRTRVRTQLAELDPYEFEAVINVC
ncbi:MAG: BREX system Lon protease-like protein BrxL [Methyloprofundus sp.]|nr:BREX system Lon protease-like protein BrxL [Methyloprofundus sp.]